MRQLKRVVKLLLLEAVEEVSEVWRLVSSLKGAIVRTRRKARMLIRRVRRKRRGRMVEV